MTAETTTEKGRSDSAVPWRWMLFGLSLVGLVTLLTIWAMDSENVVWENDKPLCPHCRSEVEPYGTRCVACDQSFDWLPDEILCDLCMSSSDVARIRAVAAEVREQVVREAASADQVQAFLTWAAEIDRGECVYCAGTGKDIWAPEGKNKEPCPVCLGDGDCILCDGDIEVRVGDRRAHDEIVEHRRQISILSGRLGSATAAKRADAYEDVLGDLRGTVEIREVLLPDGRNAVEVAKQKRDEILRLLPIAPID